METEEISKKRPLENENIAQEQDNKNKKLKKNKDDEDDDDILNQLDKEPTKKAGYNGKFRNLKKHTAIWSSETPVKGLFVTCDQLREGNSVGEIDPILRGFAEKYLPKLNKPCNNMDNDKTPTGNKEEKKEIKIFNFINSGCSGIYFVSISNYPDLNPTDFVNSIFVDIYQRKIKKLPEDSPYRLKLKYILESLPESTKKMINEADQSVIISNKLIAKLKFTQRVLPIIETSVSGQSEVTEMSKKIMNMLNQINPKSFAIEIKSRNNSLIDKKELLNEVAGYANPSIKVNLKKPEYSVIIEIIKSSVVMGIVNLYGELYRYNIKELCRFNPMGELTKPNQKPEDLSCNEKKEEQENKGN